MSCLSLLLAASIHVGLEGDYQNVHPHVRCEVEHSDNLLANVDTSRVEVGLVTGYSSYSLLPMVRVTYDKWYISPAYETDNWGIVLGWETKLF